MPVQLAHRLLFGKAKFMQMMKVKHLLHFVPESTFNPSLLSVYCDTVNLRVAVL